MPYQATCVFGQDLVAELASYTERQGIDLMVFVSKQRSFWEALLSKDIAQNMALATHTPMMVMHLESPQT